MVINPKELQTVLRKQQELLSNVLEQRIDELLRKIPENNGSSKYLSTRFCPEDRLGVEYEKLNLEYRNLLLEKYTASGWSINFKYYNSDFDKKFW